MVDTLRCLRSPAETLNQENVETHLPQDHYGKPCLPLRAVRQVAAEALLAEQGLTIRRDMNHCSEKTCFHADAPPVRESSLAPTPAGILSRGTLLGAATPSTRPDRPAHPHPWTPPAPPDRAAPSSLAAARR